MTQLTTTPEGFRTAAYLAARARLDAARSRSGKTSRRVSCNPPNVRCGGRCIPPSWDCRLKGEGPDPQLRAVKTDPLSGFANIQRGIGRITKGVTRGNLSEVQGGRAAIIRGVVKTVPGDIQQKKQLKTTLENRTRAIGLGLAVVTTGLGMHALLMNGNIRYREGVGKNINNSIRLGVNKVLDATPIVGANRARVATRAASGINAELTRQRNPVSAELTNQLAKTKPSPIDEAGQANLVRNLTAVNKNTGGVEGSGWMRARGGPESSFNAWDRLHQKAFWGTTKVDKSYGESSIFARPATDEFLARQFNLQGDDVLTSAAVKDAVERNLTSYKNDLIDLAQQQGFKVDKTSAGSRSINKEGRRAFIQAQVRKALPLGQSNDRVRAALTKHLEQTLTQSPSTRANGIYKETFDGFNEFYTAKAGVIESATAEPRISAEMRKTGAAETLFSARQARASFVSGKDVKGPSHAELVLRQYFEQSVAGNPRRMFTVTDRLASAAASEIEGRNVGPAEAFRVLEREGISGAVPQRTTAAPRSSAGLASQASLSTLARSIRARAGNENMSMEASLRQARAELARRGDSADLPTRVRSYLEARRDFKEGGRLGKPCGESHIPKAHECRKGRGAQAAPAPSESKNNTKTIAAAALLGTAAVATGLYVVHDLKRVEKQTNMFKASPSIKTTIKQAKVDFDTKKSGTAMGNYYTQKSGLKPGDVVYYRNEKDPAAHFGVYLGEGADGKVRAVMANTNEKRAGFIDIFEVGTTKPNSNDAAHFMLPVLQKAPTLGGNARLSNEETVRRALRSVGSDYKFSLTRDNCEVLANSIAYGTPRSQQLERFTRVTRAVADSTIGVQQRTVGTIRRARGQTVTKALTAKQIMARLERDDSTFLTTEGKTVAGAHYKQFFADGTRFDARYDALGELLTPAQVWSKIKDYDDLQKAIAMRDYLLLVRLASETEQARTDAKGKGKPCGESFIPRTHECRVRAGQTIAKVALAAGVVGGAAFALRKAKLGEFHTGLMTGNVGGVRKRRMSFMEKNQTALNSEQLAKTFTDLKKQKGVIPENVDALQSFIRKDNIVNDPANFYKDLEAGLNQAKAINKPQQEATLRQVKLLNTLGGFDGLASQYSNNVYVRSIRKNAATLSADPQEVTNTVGKFMDLRSGTPNNTILPTDPNFKKLFTVASSTKNGDAAEYINTIHEIAHKVHFRASVKTGSTPDTIGLGIVYNPLENPKFMQTRDKAGMNAQLRRSSSGYGLSDYEGRKAETFAELSVLYVTQGKRFKQDNPLAYDWVDDIWKTANG